MSGSIVGTPIHMAPELFTGKLEGRDWVWMGLCTLTCVLPFELRAVYTSSPGRSSTGKGEKRTGKTKTSRGK